MGKKKMVFLLVIIVLAVFISYKVYTNHKDQNLIKTIDTNNLEYVKPYIENITFRIEDDVYYSRVTNTSIGEHIDKYNEEDASVTVEYNIYKNKVSEDMLFDTSAIRIAMSKEPGNSAEYYINIRDYAKDETMSLHFELLDEFIQCYDSYIEDSIRKNTNIDIIEYNKSGKCSYNEDILVDRNYDILEPGDCTYKAIMYSEFHSRTYDSKYYLEDSKADIEILIDTEGVEGDYNVLWNIEKDKVQNIGIHGYDSYTLNKYNQDRLIDYLKKLSFESTKSGIDIDENIDITIESDWMDYDISLSTDTIGHNDSDKICIGLDHVEKIKELIGYRLTIKPDITNSISYYANKDILIEEIEGIHVFTNAKEYEDYISKCMNIEEKQKHYKVDFEKENLITYSKVIEKSGQAYIIIGLEIECNQVKIVLNEMGISFREGNVEDRYCVMSDIIVDKNVINEGMEYISIGIDGNEN